MYVWVRVCVCFYRVKAWFEMVSVRIMFRLGFGLDV